MFLTYRVLLVSEPEGVVSEDRSHVLKKEQPTRVEGLETTDVEEYLSPV